MDQTRFTAKLWRAVFAFFADDCSVIERWRQIRDADDEFDVSDSLAGTIPPVPLMLASNSQASCLPRKHVLLSLFYQDVFALLMCDSKPVVLLQATFDQTRVFVTSFTKDFLTRHFFGVGCRSNTVAVVKSAPEDLDQRCFRSSDTVFLRALRSPYVHVDAGVFPSQLKCLTVLPFRDKEILLVPAPFAGSFGVASLATASPSVIGSTYPVPICERHSVPMLPFESPLATLFRNHFVVVQQAPASDRTWQFYVLCVDLSNPKSLRYDMRNIPKLAAPDVHFTQLRPSLANLDSLELFAVFSAGAPKSVLPPLGRTVGVGLGMVGLNLPTPAPTLAKVEVAKLTLSGLVGSRPVPSFLSYTVETEGPAPRFAVAVCSDPKRKAEAPLHMLLTSKDHGLVLESDTPFAQLCARHTPLPALPSICGPAASVPSNFVAYSSPSREPILLFVCPEVGGGDSISSGALLAWTPDLPHWVLVTRGLTSADRAATLHHSFVGSRLLMCSHLQPYFLDTLDLLDLSTAKVNGLPPIPSPGAAASPSAAGANSAPDKQPEAPAPSSKQQSALSSSSRSPAATVSRDHSLSMADGAAAASASSASGTSASPESGAVSGATSRRASASAVSASPKDPLVSAIEKAAQQLGTTWELVGDTPDDIRRLYSGFSQESIGVFSEFNEEMLVGPLAQFLHALEAAVKAGLMLVLKEVANVLGHVPTPDALIHVTNSIRNSQPLPPLLDAKINELATGGGILPAALMAEERVKRWWAQAVKMAVAMFVECRPYQLVSAALGERYDARRMEGSLRTGVPVQHTMMPGLLSHSNNLLCRITVM